MVAPSQPSDEVSGVAVLALRCFLIEKYGNEQLRNVLEKGESAAVRAVLDEQLDNTSTLPPSTIANVSRWLHEHMGADLRVLFFEFGQFFFTHVVREAGYEQSIFQVSDNFTGFARSLNQIMLQMFAVLGHPKRGLAFKPHCTNVTSSSFDLGGFLLNEACSAFNTAMHIELHKGIMARAASQVFALNVQFTDTELRSLASGKELQVTRVSFSPPLAGTFPGPEPKGSVATEAEGGQQALHGAKNNVGLDPDTFSELFPFHFAIDTDFKVLQAGSAISRMIPQMVPGVHISEVLVICLPDMCWDMDYIDVLLQNSMHSKVVLTSHDNLAFKGGLHRVPAGRLSLTASGCYKEWGEALVFLGSPLVTSVEDMKLHKLYLSDFPPSDLTPDHVLMADTKHDKAACSLKLAHEKNLKLESALAQALSSQDEIMLRPKLDTTSVADLVLGLLDALVLGGEVQARDVLAAREALLRAEGTNLWSPLLLDAQAMDRDEEVNASLGKLLGATSRQGSVEMPSSSAGPRRAPSTAASRNHMISPSGLSSTCRSSESHPHGGSLPDVPDDGSSASNQPTVHRSSGSKEELELELHTTAATPGACAAPSNSPGRVQAAHLPEEEQLRVGTAGSSDQSRDTSGALPRAARRPRWFPWLMGKLRPPAAAAKTVCEPGVTAVTAVKGPVPAKEAGPAGCSEADSGMAGSRPVKPASARSRLSRPSSGGAAGPSGKEGAITRLVHQPSEKLTAALGRVGDWQFDSFELERAADGRPLSCLAFFLMTRLDIIQVLDLSESRLQRFLLRIEAGYPDHPYHNRTHAADVLRTLYVVMTQGGVAAALKARSSAPGGSSSGASQAMRSSAGSAATSDAVDMLTVMLAAIVHDYQHRGVNNDFLIRSSDPLAMLYNDVSPLENHHVAASMSLLREESCAFFPEGSSQLQGLIRKDVIDMVLATDMKQHFALSGTFSSKVANQGPRSHPGDELLPGSRDLGIRAEVRVGPHYPHRDQSATLMPTLAKTAFLSPKSTNLSSLRGSEPLPAWDHGTQMLILKIALKCSDLGHLTGTTEVHRQWVARLEEELFRQGDQERALGHPVSALMDRTKTGITKSQCGFINVVAHPMFELLAQAFPACQHLVTNLNSNLDHWK